MVKVQKVQIVQCKNLHENFEKSENLANFLSFGTIICEKSENSYSAERLFYKFSCISQKNVVSLHAKLRAKAKKEQAGYEYEDKDR